MHILPRRRCQRSERNYVLRCSILRRCATCINRTYTLCRGKDPMNVFRTNPSAGSYSTPFPPVGLKVDVLQYVPARENVRITLV